MQIDDNSARTRVMPRGTGGGETLARVPDTEKLGILNWSKTLTNERGLMDSLFAMR